MIADQSDLLDLIAGDRIHTSDREAITDAIRRSVRHDGTVSSNDWRPNVPTWVHHKLVGATVHALISDGSLVPTGEWVMSNDAKGRNVGKPQRLYRWAGAR